MTVICVLFSKHKECVKQRAIHFKLHRVWALNLIFVAFSFTTICSKAVILDLCFLLAAWSSSVNSGLLCDYRWWQLGTTMIQMPLHLLVWCHPGAQLYKWHGNIFMVPLSLVLCCKLNIRTPKGFIRTIQCYFWACYLMHFDIQIF